MEISGNSDSQPPIVSSSSEPRRSMIARNRTLGWSSSATNPSNVARGNMSPRLTPCNVAADTTDLQTPTSAEPAGIHALPSRSKAHNAFQALSNSPRENGTSSNIVFPLVFNKESLAGIDSGPMYIGRVSFKIAMVGGDVRTSSNVAAHCAIDERTTGGIVPSSSGTGSLYVCFTTKNAFDDCTWRTW